jgi:hypothetical protein
MSSDMLGINEVRASIVYLLKKFGGEGGRKIRGLIADLLEKLGSKNGEKWRSQLRLFLRQEPCWVIGKIVQYFVVTVDYAMSFNDMVVAGKYDNVGDCVIPRYIPIITSSFGGRKMEVEFQLIGFDHDIDFMDVIRELDSEGLRPAKAEELFAFAAQFPGRQLGFPIASLDTLWKGSSSQSVLFISSFGAKRIVDVLELGMGDKAKLNKSFHYLASAK